jgi:hypothetical protein
MHIKPGTEAANAQAPQLNGGKPGRIGTSNHSNLKPIKYPAGKPNSMLTAQVVTLTTWHKEYYCRPFCPSDV